MPQPKEKRKRGDVGAAAAADPLAPRRRSRRAVPRFDPALSPVLVILGQGTFRLSCLICFAQAFYRLLTDRADILSFVPAGEIIEKQHLLIVLSDGTSNVVVHDVRDKELR